MLYDVFCRINMLSYVLSCVVFLNLNRVNADTGWFWHVTDFHYDPTYEGVALSCEKNASDRGMYGFNWCDSPWKLITSSINAMHDIKSDIDFIVWTGDSTPHIKDNVASHDMYRDILTNITKELKKVFNSTTVYAAFGNHDYYPGHQFPPNNNDMYNEIYEQWKDWINDDQQAANFHRGGYYTVKTSTGLRMMVLNTNLYYRSDKISYLYRYSDPAGQFQWMAETLEKARTTGEKVIIMSHVPSGIIPTEKSPWMYPQFNHRFNEILLDYSDVISGLYFGHEHVDNFGLHFKSGSPVLVKLCAPSVTPWTYVRSNGEAEPTRNPAIRLVNYNQTSGEPLVIQQYYLDISLSNTNKRTDWRLEYTMPKDYGMTDLSPKSFRDLVERMKTHNSHEFSNYARRRYIGGATGDVRVTSCTSDACKKPFICSLLNADVRDFEYCDTDGFNRIIPVG